LPLDKPVGPTSHDMVAQARRELGIRKVGHTGTLDPFASGLLLLVLGRATRLVEHLHVFPKEYEARARLGVGTETDDSEGEELQASDAWEGLSSADVSEALASLAGKSLQRPPRYSAKKIGGDPSYALARRGVRVELPEVPIEVHRIELVAFRPPEVDFRVLCSTGTYVRALARDLGESLGVGAHLTGLRRTAIGPHRVEGAIRPDQLGDPDAVARALVPPARAVDHLPRIEIEEEAVHRMETGRTVRLDEVGSAGPGVPEEGALAALTAGTRLVALAVREGGLLRPRKVFPVE